MSDQTIVEKAAQLVFPRFGSNMPPPVAAEDDFERVAALLDRFPFGGLILFNGNVSRTPPLLRTLQGRSSEPLLIATDMEAGLGQQMGGATVFPHAMAFDHVGLEAEELLERSAVIAAREALASGVHLTLAPVADVHRNPRNPIISIRAFSSDPERAGRLAATYVRAVHSVGLLATAKHFPGHGGTTEDSHAETPLVTDARTELETTDLLPFRKCIEAGVDVVMTAHVAFKALDPALRPATLSPPILRDLLRAEMGFEGVIMSDSMMMEGVLAADPSPSARLIAAGADVVLDPRDPVKAVEEIAEAVRSGEISEETLDRAVQRVQALRARMISTHGPTVFSDPASLFPDVDPASADHRRVAAQVARAALTVSNPDHPNLWTLRRKSGRIAIAVVPSIRSARLTGPLVDALRRAVPDAAVVQLDPKAMRVDAEETTLAEADVVVFVIVARPAAWHAYGLSSTQQEAVRRGLGRGSSVLAVLGSMDLLRAFPDATATVCAHSDMPPSQEELVRYLFSRDS